MTRVEEPSRALQQQRCVGDRCDDDALPPCGLLGDCICPCHELSSAVEVEAFARGLRGEPDLRCPICGRWLRDIRSPWLPRHKREDMGDWCHGGGSFPLTPL